VSKSTLPPTPFAIHDKTTLTGGYIAIMDGRGNHVCDLFPFAKRAGPHEGDVEHYHKLARLVVRAAGDASLYKTDRNNGEQP
jgi:hypothetical protein